MSHRWHFFRAGGVDQVSLRDGSDLLALPSLDHKLWVALAMPVKDVDVDPETLALIDVDHDGRIRVHDILEVVKFVEATFSNPDDLLRSSDEVKLTAIKDERVVAAARRMLADLGRKDAPAISVADADAITKAFATTVLNGDGVVIPESTEAPELRRAISDALEKVGSVPDRSGKPGLDTKLAEALFAAVDQRAAWLARGRDGALATLGDATADAYASLDAVRAKLDDYFTRCRVAAFEPRAGVALAAQEAELVALASRALSASDEQLARLPLARIDPQARLELGAGINPAWAERIQAFVDRAVVPVLGARTALTREDVAQIEARLAAWQAWRADEPKTPIDGLDRAWIEKLAGPELRGKLAALIASDAALAAEYDQIVAVDKTVRLQRDLGRILRNFVNFSDFYSRRDGAFQCGTLYFDSRALHLCIPVSDAAKHGALAASSDAYLAYCDIVRKGETRQIAVALTNGDADNVFVGRNGIFYDRDGLDWDATVTKIVANPISVRQAFWAPYKKLVKTIEDAVTKRAQAAEAESMAKIDVAGAAIGSADKAATTASPAPIKKMDLGTVAALGVAIGGIGTLFGALLATLFGLGPWLPFGIAAILLMISGPSMLLAWLKLRRRNLGPILDANGWAINGRARVNVAFGAAMTELAVLPKGSHRTLDDPFADKKTPWKRWVVLAIVVLLAGAWFVGKLDRWLPTAVRSTQVLGKYAPAAKQAAPAAEAPAAAAPAAPAPAPAPAP